MTGSDRDWNAFATPRADGTVHMDVAVEGITCAACMGTIERGLKSLPGVAAARVNLTTHRLALDWRPGDTDATVIVARLERLGYRAHPFDPGRRSAEEDSESKELLRCLGAAGFGAMNIMLLSVSVWSGNVTDIDAPTRDLFHWVSALIAIPVVAYAGRPFFRSAFRAVKALRTNMDVPISIGITLTLGLSIFETMRSSEHAFFDSVVMLLFFLLTGRFLDHDMRRRTRSVAENMAALRVQSAARIGADGEIRDVPLSRVDPGDLVLVRPGERVSVDGVVEDGGSGIDQSLVTGETTLVEVGPGARVHAGTLNVSGVLKVRVTAATAGTLLDEVNRLLENAAQARSRYMRLADRASRAYAPVVHSAALLTAIGWMLAGRGAADSLVIAVSVLIITCPCALALAIPAVQVVTSGILFRSGVLLHSGDAVERLAVVDTVVFDKTGTLTLPEPRLLNAADVDLDRLAAAGRLARASRHPLGMALADATRAGAPPADVREVPGLGIETEIDGRLERLGAPAWCGVAPETVAALLARFPGASLVAHADGREPPILCAFAQGLRVDAPAVVAALVAEGCAVEILSGDREAAVAEVAARLGVATWAAGLTPTDKIARLAALKAAGRTVLMVGDGLNDAPALAAAHVSMSPVTAVHLSQAAADAVFLGDRLAPVLSALRTARRARRAMIQNLGLSVAYNLIAVPVAVAGLVTPLIAALAMSGSSILVTLNALRLRLGAER
ncbi:heavy metal translocating P-type ATPase [Siculibacillus lacustris]|uniref:Heavy metal translocating P-type ATPase n=1 Tax=Siculibacillus lacustris TaxID=1549641 RepID=A0A4V2KTH0_9HYPH|nr:heavy metal translocating P-type ATPase [Siculibacillus lacustris]TBW37234.1 heavy metal translocating P-type ATPase [Siculibacillus lacustris]